MHDSIYQSEFYWQYCRHTLNEKGVVAKELIIVY